MRALLIGLALSSLITWAAPPRDPFAKPAELQPPVAACATSLCRHALAELKLVAIVARGPDSVAMFENQQGKGFLARRNAQIGNAGARVTQIDRECLTLTKFTASANGHYESIAERVCVPGAAPISEHDYLRDGPYEIP
jgi:Tfp pilus assembly protein PilP